MAHKAFHVSCRWTDAENRSDPKLNSSAGTSEHSVGGNADRRQIGVVLHVVLLQLCKDVLSVRVLAQHSNMRTELGDELLALRWVSHVNHSLDHVICVLVLHHSVQRAVLAENTTI